MELSHKTKWSEERIISKIMEMVNFYDMEIMPTYKEMNEYFGDSSLSCAISKHGGAKYFLEKTGLTQKKCESTFGEEYELLAIKHIKENTNLDSKKMKTKYPYDILTNNNIKIDIKASNGIKKGERFFHSFNLEKINPTCDIFIAYCMKEKSVEKIIIIPSCVISGIRRLHISDIGKYDKYINNWEVIKQYDDFYNNIIKQNDYR